ncbi:MAG: DUF853 family protein [Gammaproteobacteria bacterium]|jgi:DNA helicase HerA-like ATPase|nr:DUF853 family protein [Gammaproteobacteria bacterium]
MNEQLVIGGSDGLLVTQAGQMANRHGLIAGATGTGKTVTLQVLAEGFSRLGTPVFAADVKGDLAGICQPGKPHPEVDRRLGLIPLPDYQQRGYPTLCWDIYGEQGHPLRTTVSELGPLLLANLLELNETQTGVLYACFAVADDEGLLLLDLKDLRAMLDWLSEHRRELPSRYGNLAPASIGAIQRRLLSELFEELPEAGDLPAPKMVLFFDEAHLLFDGMPKSLLDKIEQVVRLIRSKGVGVYFVTQSPLDLPQPVLGQLGLKVQHALRAFTPADQKALRSVVAGFRQDSSFDVAEALTQMGLGEALVSTLQGDGTPSTVQRTLIRPPESRIGPVSAEERATLLARSPLKGRYDTELDRESAYELLARRAEEAAARARDEEEKAAQAKAAAAAEKPRGRQRQGIGEALLKSAARSVGRSLGNRLVRGLLGSLLK